MRPASRFLKTVFVCAGFNLACGFGIAAHLASIPKRDDLSQAELSRVRTVTMPTGDFSKAEAFEAMPAGAATLRMSPSKNAMAHMSANLALEKQQDFWLGEALFGKLWVSSPSSTQASDGLGPLFNARACASCHRGSGRGQPPDTKPGIASTIVRLARPPQSTAETELLAKLKSLSFPDPVYGDQLQNLAVPGLAAEGQLNVRYQEHIFTLADGETVSLREPFYSIRNPGYGPLNPHTTLSPRMAQPLLGLGLIEAVTEADILALADPDDQNHDGISGKAAFVSAPHTDNRVLSRFGWKAQNATLRAQSADAFRNDLGISTPDRPLSQGDCTPAQAQCQHMPDGVQERLGTTEAPDPVLDLVTFYVKNLALPTRPAAGDPLVLRGKKLFYESGCVSCHTPKFVTRKTASDKTQSFQLIWPYSDFLLHDMGDDLADGQQVGLATGREWRTPPLWGLSLTKTTKEPAFFMHDGRARNLTEAILWHGGEAEKARQAFSLLARDDRQALLTFLESL